ncbi:prepilin peptidase [Luteimicrobium subarcticum]|uniref:Leader peptidase (Prepilin peptidase)/N-methyltransferase n=1 Tax=Luteimicrobium subarcticum TaxID=620910 RepID=A0A2M8W3X6_9MICO|nr:A24 family peptidase [Luteimicrobium subarcticum]PJI85627.1 leader peptidase (prepilin peptidase)/N-methyltransferase [Luteimicrobium subarcticum]
MTVTRALLPERAGLLARALGELHRGGVVGVTLGVLAAVVTGRATWSAPVVGAVVLVAFVSGPLAVVDARTRRLPDTITLPSIALTAILVVVPSLVAGQQAAAVRALVGAAAAAGLHLVLWYVGAGIGLGDVKLVALLGLPLAWYGWSTLLGGLFVGYLLGGLWAVGLVVTRRAGMRATIPFGPFLVAGWFVATLST